MKRLLRNIMAAGAIALALGGCAPLSPEQKAAKEAQKALDAQQEAMRHANAVAALKSMNFVLEADRITFRKGESLNIPSSLNFISSKDGKTTVQLGSYRGAGLNGVGGITVEGKASDVKVATGKNGVVNLSMYVNGAGISAAVRISLFGSDNQATAIVEPNLSANRITLSGTVYPASESHVYKGMSL